MWKILAILITLLPNIITTSIKSLDDLDAVIKANSDKYTALQKLASEHEFTMIALFDEDSVTRNDLKLTQNMNRAITYLQHNVKEGYSGDIKLVLNRVKLTDYQSAEVKKYHIHAHSLPKFLFFSKFGEEFATYKGGKSEKMIRAWVQRRTRNIGSLEYQFRNAYQFDKSVYFFYFGNSTTATYKYLESNFWSRKTKLPIYHLTKYDLLNTIHCLGTNKTADDFVLLISKNSTYTPCFCLSGKGVAETSELIKNMTKFIKETPDLETIKRREIKNVKPYIVELFEKAE